MGELVDTLKRHALDVGAIILLALLALLPLARAGLSNSDDILIGIYRLFSLDASWQAGVFYPRLSPDLAFGYGVPLFQFYAPLVSYVSELFHVAGLGFIGAIKATYLLGLILGGLGMYVYVLRLFGSRAGALLGAVAYIYAPYQFVDIFTRGATAEALALALLPWALYGFHGLHATGARAWFLLSTLGLTALLLTHNSLSLFFLPVLAVYLVMLGLGRRWLLCLAAVGLALGLSAFFWLPAMVERSYVNLAPMTQGIYDPTRYLAPLRELVQRSFLFDYTAPLGFRWGLLPVTLALCGLVVGFWRLQPQRRWLLFFALLVAGGLLLQLPAAAPFWAYVPLVRFLQFPWRLLAFVSLGGAVLIGALPVALTRGHGWNRSDSPGPAWASWALGCGVAVLLILAATARLWPAYLGAWPREQLTDDMLSRQDMDARGRLGFELFSDYQPIWVQIPMTDVSLGRSVAGEAMPPPASPPAVKVLRWQAAQVVAQVTAADAFPLTIHRFYFPGWQARLDGNPALVYPSGELGLVTVDVPGGTHTVELRFDSTLWQRAATGVAFVSLIALFLIAAPLLRRRPWLAAALLLLTLVGATVWFVGRPGGTPPPPRDLQANLGHQAQLTGYTLDQASYRAGESVQVTLYWLGLRQPDKDYKVFVHLRDVADQRMISQHDGAPVDGYTPTTRWTPGELLADEHPLSLPADVRPGTYQIWVGMYDPTTGARLSFVAPPGQDRLLIGTVTVR